MSELPVVHNTSYLSPVAGKVLRHEIIVNADQADVWRAFTTSEGLRSFAAPVAQIDLRIGGTWESSYNPDARIGDPNNIQNEVLSFLPMEMLSTRIKRTPPGFPHPELGKQLWTVLQFFDLGNRQVKVVGSMLGWQDGPDWEPIYALFERGNASVLEALREALERRPVNPRPRP